MNCSTSYVGMTSRSLKEWLDEHWRLCDKVILNDNEKQKLEKTSVIALHAITGHRIDKPKAFQSKVSNWTNGNSNFPKCLQ